MQKKETTAPVVEEVKAEVMEAAKTVEKAATEAAKTVETKAKEAETKAKEVAKTTTRAAKTAGKTVAKKAAEAKKPGRKPAAKKAEAEVKMIVQYQNNDTDIDTIQEKVKAQFVAEGHRAGSIKSLNIYVKPEEYSAYYVINEKFSGRVDLF